MSHPSTSLGEGPDTAGTPGAEHVPVLDLPFAVGAPSRGLAATLASEEDKLLACVHCGFCLPACPTYTRLGDENDSPRGRLLLMRAVGEGRLDAASPAFQLHIDRCLGCRACETVCPAGVQYGGLLELAREEAVRAGGSRWHNRLVLGLFTRPRATRVAMIVARALRATRLPALAARVLPAWGWLRGIRLAAGMLAASAPWHGLRRAPDRVASDGPASAEGVGSAREDGAALAAARGGDSGRTLDSTTPTAMLLGCVQQGLFGRVNRATQRVLEANGVRVVDAPEQGCCGALHAHGGDLEGARMLARRNLDAFAAAGAEAVVVNSAGCGAVMKEYGHLLEHDGAYAERAARFALGVRDVSEVLAERGPWSGAPIGLKVTADAPCHLLHAQGVAEAPGIVLDAVPGAVVVPLRASDECCGGAGLYGITHAELGGRIGADKVAAVTETGADVVVTGNPGCAMQIGAGLRMAGTRCRVLHPVELLDESTAAPGGTRRPGDWAGRVSEDRLRGLRTAADALVPSCLATLEVLVTVESPSGDAERVERVAVRYALELQQRSAQVERAVAPGFGVNLIGRIAGTAHGEPPLLLVGHLDTVHPVGSLARMPFAVHGDRVTGPGAYDMKGGLAVALSALDLLRAQGLEPARDLVFVITCDEEVGSGTSRALLEAEARGAFGALVLEPCVPGGAAKTRRKGVGGFRVEVRGLPAHAGIEPEAGASAIHELTALLDRIRALADPAQGTTINVGVIEGGTRSNVVAERARAEVDVRVWTAAEGERITRAVRALTPANTRCTLAITGGINRGPLERTEASGRLFDAARAVAAAQGWALSEGSTGGASDGNLLSASGCPTLDGLGPDGGGAHALDEHVRRSDIAPRIALLAGLLARL